MTGWNISGRFLPERRQKIRAGAKFDLARMAELEKETRHDVMAFVKNVAENLGEEGRYVHYGVTSYDIVDTALALLLRDATDQIIVRAKALTEVIRAKAREHKNTVMIGRTHGIHAEPITFAFKLATWLDEMNHNMERLEQARTAISVGKISGAVGTHANIGQDVEKYVCGNLGLGVAPISTQIIARDRHAQLMATLAITGGEPGTLLHGNPQHGAHGNPRSAGVFCGGAERLLGHAAQAQPLEQRDDHRPGPRGARQPDPDAGKHGDVARA